MAFRMAWVAWSIAMCAFRVFLGDSADSSDGTADPFDAFVVVLLVPVVELRSLRSLSSFLFNFFFSLSVSLVLVVRGRQPWVAAADAGTAAGGGVVGAREGLAGVDVGGRLARPRAEAWDRSSGRAKARQVKQT